MNERVLTEKDKEMIERFRKKTEELAKTIGQPPKKDYSFWRYPRKYKLTETEKADAPRKLQEYIAIKNNAMIIVQKHIKRLQDEDKIKNKDLINKLKYGLGVLERGKQNSIQWGIDNDEDRGIIGYMERFPRGRRGGIGLSRGFGELLCQFGPECVWKDEIMNAIDKIEDYHADM